MTPSPGAGRRPTRHPARRALTLAGALAVVAGCGGSDAGDAERFCGEIAADTSAVVAPALTTDADLAATLEHYRTLADLAPAAIEQEWSDLVVNLETVSTVVPDDEASMQRAVAQAYATERSAVVVRDWLMANCSVDLGPVATITPHDRVSGSDDEPVEAPTDDGGDPEVDESGDG